MPCRYCPKIIEKMIKDPLLNCSNIYYDKKDLEQIAQFILRNKDFIKHIIDCFEKKVDP